MLARILCFVLALLGCAAEARAGTAKAQDPARGPEAYHAKMWTIASGLPQGSVNDLVQTGDGALWVATFGGLLRFDGIEFRVYDLDTLPGLPSNRITALTQDGQGGVWLTAQSGHLVHVRDERVLECFALPDAGEEPLALARHPQGSLWVHCSSGALYRCGDGQWLRVLPPSRAGQYEGVCVTSDGTLAAVAGDEVVRCSGDGQVLARLRAPALVLSLAPAIDHGLWVGLANGVARERDGALVRESIGMPAGLGVRALIDEGGGGLWLGTNRGPVHVARPGEPSRGAVVESEEELPSGLDVRALLRDREGNLWMGSNGLGLLRLRPHRLESFGPVPTRLNVCAVAEDGEGGAWVASDNRGLFHVVDGQWDVKRVELPQVGGKPGGAQALLHDRGGRVWLGSGVHLLRCENTPDAPFEVLLPERTFVPRVGPMVECTSGDVWIASVAGLLVRVGREDRVVQELDTHVPIASLALAPDQSLWIGGEDVLLHLEGETLTRFGPESGLPRGTIRDVLAEKDGSVWIASYGGGLGWMWRGRAGRISRAQGLPDNALSRILEDDRQRLWLLSNLGLVVIPRSDLRALVDGRRARLDPVVLGPESGMPEANFGQPAGMRDLLGHLWFGTIAGVIRIDPQDFPFNRTVPISRIERVVADEHELALGTPTIVPAGTRRVELGFTAFALTAPERVHFRYRLEGYDEVWNSAGSERRVSYTALAPGDYTFAVEARNEDGVWSSQPVELRLHLVASWWQTWTFRVLAALGAATLLYLAYRYRIGLIHQRAAALLALSEDRARAEQRESRLREELAHAGRVATAGELATSLAHEVNQPLAAIVTNAQAGRRFLARESLDRANLDEILGDIAQQGQRASEVIRRLREFLRKHAAEREPIDLSQVVRDTLPLLRREIQDHGVEVELALAEDLPAVLADPVQLQQVVVNLVKNACEALDAVPAPRRVAIHTRRYDGRVWMEIRDNGPGLAPEVAGRLFQPYVTTKSSGMGLGLAICRSIVESHGGRMSADSAPGGGLRLLVDLPACVPGEERA